MQAVAAAAACGGEMLTIHGPNSRRQLITAAAVHQHTKCFEVALGWRVICLLNKLQYMKELRCRSFTVAYLFSTYL